MTKLPNELEPSEFEAYIREGGAAGDEVRHRAFEQYVFALVKGGHEVAMRLRRKYGVDDHHDAQIHEVKLEGEYPETKIMLRIYQRSLDRESWYPIHVWSPQNGKEGELVDANDKPLPNWEQRLNDALMHARGG
jgi:hypothetical protein